jgi:hypothetical protein
MTRGKLVLAGLGLLSAVSVASAADVDLYFISGCGDNPSTASNATKYLGDAAQDSHLAALAPFNGAVDYHHGNLELYMKVATKGSGCGGETISSLGLDVNLVRTSGTSSLSADAFTVYTAAATTGSAQNPWSAPSPNTPTLNVAGKIVQDSRAVAVPTAHAPTETLWNGYCPGGPYHVATLAMHTGGTPLGAGNGSTTWELRMAVGNLKITRVYDPTAIQGSATDSVRFGTGDAATDNGSVVGVQNNTVADATVIARKKGDFGSFDSNGNFLPVPDGIVSSPEAAQFLAAVGKTCATDPVLTYVGDFGSFDSNGNFSAQPDGVVSSPEYAQFLAAVGS